MPIVAKESGSPRELIPVGNHIARCIGVTQIGTVVENIMGQDKRMHKIRLTWELPLETRVFDKDKGEQPYVFSKEYTLSLSEKAKLRESLQSWRGKAFTAEELQGFDITNVVGVPCMLNIIHEPSKKDPTKKYEALASVAALSKGVKCPPQVNPSKIFSLDNWDSELFDTFPDFIKDKIRSSEEYKDMIAAKQEPDPALQKTKGKVEDAELVSEDLNDLPF